MGAEGPARPGIGQGDRVHAGNRLGQGATSEPCEQHGHHHEAEDLRASWRTWNREGKARVLVRNPVCMDLFVGKRLFCHELGRSAIRYEVQTTLGTDADYCAERAVAPTRRDDA